VRSREAMPSALIRSTNSEDLCAIKVVHKHGYVVTGLRRDADGFTIMTRKPGEASDIAKPVNEWDEIFDGKDQSQTR
jgi:hypothetical protein